MTEDHPAKPLLREQKYKQIEAVFAQWRLAQAAGGASQCRATSRGLWASSTPREVFSLLAALGAEGCSRFVDLGSGDGLVTCIASLFCPAAGIECDPRLVETAGELRDRLGLAAEFICADFLTLDLSGFDLLYIYPDKPLYDLEHRLAPGLRGRLVVYGTHFPLRLLPALRTIQLPTCRATVYGPPPSTDAL